MTIVLSGLEVQAGTTAPSLIYVCVLDSSETVDSTSGALPTPGEVVDGEVLISGLGILLPPGMSEASLPLVEELVDTSPSQMIGCLSDGHLDTELWLEYFFPSAVNGDGVINRLTNEIWVLVDGQWTNSGDSPGETVVGATAVVPYNISTSDVIETRSSIAGSAITGLVRSDSEVVFLSRSYISSGSGLAIRLEGGASALVQTEAPEQLNSFRRSVASDFQVVEYLGDGTNGRLLTTAVVPNPRIFWAFSSIWTRINNAYQSSWNIGSTVNATPTGSSSGPAVSSDTTGYVAVSRGLNLNDTPYRTLMIGGSFGTVPEVIGLPNSATTSRLSSGLVSDQIFVRPSAATSFEVPHGLEDTPALVILKALDTVSGAQAQRYPFIAGPALDAATGTPGSLMPFYNVVYQSTSSSLVDPSVLKGAVGVNQEMVSLPANYTTTAQVISIAERQFSTEFGYYDGDGSEDWREIELSITPEFIYIIYIGHEPGVPGQPQLNGRSIIHGYARPWLLSRIRDPSGSLEVVNANWVSLEGAPARITRRGFEVRAIEFSETLVNTSVGSLVREQAYDLAHTNSNGGRYFYMALGGIDASAFVQPDGLLVYGGGQGTPAITTGLTIQPGGIQVQVTTSPPQRVGLMPTVDFGGGLLTGVSLEAASIETESTAVMASGLGCAVSIGPVAARFLTDDRTFGILLDGSSLDWGLMDML